MLSILKNQPAHGLLYVLLKKKSGKWRMVTVLRAVKVIQSMGSLQIRDFVRDKEEAFAPSAWLCMLTQ